MAIDKAPPPEGFTDANGNAVHAFALQMHNLGYSLMTQTLLNMLQSGVWREFKDGLGIYRFLPGEFDYFLTQWGVRREDIMSGVRDIETKAKLEAAMDERRTGDEGYRRRIKDVRREVPSRPGSEIEPFGLTKSEAKALVNGRGGDASPHRPALGGTVRRFSLSGGITTTRPSEQLPPVERLRRSAMRLDDDDLADLAESIKQELRRRKQIR